MAETRRDTVCVADTEHALRLKEVSDAYEADLLTWKQQVNSLQVELTVQ